jgi:hypothetical protein
VGVFYQDAKIGINREETIEKMGNDGAFLTDIPVVFFCNSLVLLSPDVSA